MPNILNDYVTRMRDNLDSPKVFIEASAYHIISSCLGRFFHCSMMPGGKLGARPNVWFVLSSIPGRTRRSTLTEYCQYVYKHALQNFLITRFRMDPKDAKQQIFNTLIEEGTPEGIMDHIHTNSDLDYYCIVSTEFGSVLQRMGTKDYELGVSTLYSKLYYGEAHSMMLSQKGKDARNRYLRPGLYVNMFCGMQEATEYLTRTMSRQGLLRRLILIACYPEDIKRWHPPIDMFREKMYKYLWEVADDINKFMNKTTDLMSKYSIDSFDMGFSPKAEKIINGYAEKNDKALTSEGGLTDANIYMQSFWEHLAKLSMLEAIADESFNMNEHPPRGWVKKEHVETALDFLTRATQHNREIISSLGKEEEKLITSTTPLERILSIIESAGTKGIKRSDLYRKSNLTSNKLQLYVDTLLARDQIKQYMKNVGGKTITFYKILP